MCQKPSFTARKVKAKQYERFTIHNDSVTFPFYKTWIQRPLKEQ